MLLNHSNKKSALFTFLHVALESGHDILADVDDSGSRRVVVKRDSSGFALAFPHRNFVLIFNFRFASSFCLNRLTVCVLAETQNRLKRKTKQQQSKISAISNDSRLNTPI